ncbi:828_t:CDS:2, partial [Cetraspora pellucida]
EVVPESYDLNPDYPSKDLISKGAYSKLYLVIMGTKNLVQERKEDQIDESFFALSFYFYLKIRIKQKSRATSRQYSIFMKLTMNARDVQ